MRDCQVASTKSSRSGDGDGCRFSSGVDEGTSPRTGGGSRAPSIFGLTVQMRSFCIWQLLNPYQRTGSPDFPTSREGRLDTGWMKGEVIVKDGFGVKILWRFKSFSSWRSWMCQNQAYSGRGSQIRQKDLKASHSFPRASRR
jgi:hypothetical protein